MAVFDKIAPPSTPKAKRLSTVALAGAILAVVWSLFDGFSDVYLPAVVISAVTSLVMLVAGFYDFKHADADTFVGGEPE